MYPTRTTYRLAASPAAYRACHAFFRAESEHPTCIAEHGEVPYQQEAIQYPTVYAWRDDTVVGVIATKIIKDVGVVASPLHVSYNIKNHVPTLLRLIDCYEFFLRKAEIPYYIVAIPNYKPSGVRIFTELRQGHFSHSILNDRYHVYYVPVPA